MSWRGAQKRQPAKDKPIQIVKNQTCMSPNARRRSTGEIFNSCVGWAISRFEFKNYRKPRRLLQAASSIRRCAASEVLLARCSHEFVNSR